MFIFYKNTIKSCAFSVDAFGDNFDEQNKTKEATTIKQHNTLKKKQTNTYPQQMGLVITTIIIRIKTLFILL
jgi:hypothetical protein